MSHGAGPQILTAERYQFFQTVGSEGAGAHNWHSHKEESGVGGVGEQSAVLSGLIQKVGPSLRVVKVVTISTK